MELVVNIPDEEYERLTYLDLLTLRAYIKSGVPLPKGHGDLIDKYEFRKAIDDCRPFTKWYQDKYTMLNTAKADLLICLNDAPIIVKADKED